MTDLIDRADSGDIPRYDSYGDDPTRNLRADRDAILASQHHLRAADPTAEIPIVDIDDTVTYLLPGLAATQPIAPWERLIDITQPSGPATPPPVPPNPGPIIPPRPSAAETERLSLLGSLGADLPVGPFPAGYVGRHRHAEDLIAEAGALPMWSDLARIAEPEAAVEPIEKARTMSPWTPLAIAVGFGVAVYAGLVVAVLAVMGR